MGKQTDTSPDGPEWSSANYKLKSHLTALKPWLYAKNSNFRTLCQRGYVMSRHKVCIPTMAMMVKLRAKNPDLFTFSNPSPVAEPTGEFRATLVSKPPDFFGDHAGKLLHLPVYSAAPQQAIDDDVFSAAEKEMYVLSPAEVEQVDSEMMDAILSTIRNVKTRDRWERRCFQSGRFLLRLWEDVSNSVTADAGQATITTLNELVRTGVPSVSMEAFTDYADSLADLAEQLPKSEKKSDNQMASLLVTARVCKTKCPCDSREPRESQREARLPLVYKRFAET